ncbi:MAG: hydroxyacid dehydrogenase [Betaproteobacteria bacterium]
MPDPVILFDPWPRSAPLIFTPDMLARFQSLGCIVGLEESAEGKLHADLVEANLQHAVVIVGQTDLDARRLAWAPKLRAVINVEGNFAQNVDYAECFRRGVQVLTIAPVFAQPVAEMALGLALDLARGITRADRLMREGREQYGFAGNRESFVLRGTTMSFIGCGNLGRALIPLLAPFRPRLLINDPWLPDSLIRELGGEPVSLDAALAEPKVIFVLAGVTDQNTGLLSRERLQTIRSDAILLLMSRAGIVDFDALVELVAEGRFRAATDVFPQEPAPIDAPARGVERLLLSPHLAGGLPATLAGIGEMVVDDLDLILRGLPPQRLQAARRETVARWRNPPGRSYEPGTKL